MPTQLEGFNRYTFRPTDLVRLYYGTVRTLAQRVLAYIRKHELLKPGDRVAAAVSGGVDSVAMLRLLLELRQEIGIVLSVVHFNHKLRAAESDGDEHFVAELARRFELEFRCESGDVARYAAEKRLSIETAAREMRYAYFRSLLGDGCVSRIATGHTLDDQAETVLMRVVRGAGTRGLAGIYPQLSVAGSQFSDKPAICRPLLGIRRQDLETCLQTLGQSWREDASNHDPRHARNRVRHKILPVLEKDLNPAVREALAETAEIARGEEAYWECEVRRLLRPDGRLPLRVLADMPLALRRRVVRAAAEALGLRLEFRQVEEILEVCAGSRTSVELPGEWSVLRRREELGFQKTESLRARAIDYEYRLPVPGSIVVPEAGTRLEAVLVSPAEGARHGHGPEDMLGASVLGAELMVRNWRAGDRFWPRHRSAPRKIKELLQEKHLALQEKRMWPVVVKGGQVIWVRGFPVAAAFSAKDQEGIAVLIREVEI